MKLTKAQRRLLEYFAKQDRRSRNSDGSATSKFPPRWARSDVLDRLKTAGLIAKSPNQQRYIVTYRGHCAIAGVTP